MTIPYIHRPIASDLVIIIHHRQIIHPKMPRQRNGLQPNALLQTRIPNHTPSMVIHDLIPRPVEAGTQVLTRHRQSHRIGNALPQRSRRDFDALVLDLRVPRAQGVHACGVV